MSSDRERGIIGAFVSVAEAMTDDYDILDLYSGLTATCAELLAVEWVGLLLVDFAGVLQVAAASSEDTHNLEVFQVQCQQGPCLDCFHSGTPVSVPDLEQEAARWPRFVPTAVAAGFASVHALPMRLHSRVLGALGLFGAKPGALNDDDLALGQSLANVAGIALAAARSGADGKAVNAQLQHALDSRIVVEQAKGFLSQHAGLDVDQSFEILRWYSRDRNLRLTEVARELVSRELAGETLLAHARVRGLGQESSRARCATRATSTDQGSEQM